MFGNNKKIKLTEEKLNSIITVLEGIKFSDSQSIRFHLTNRESYTENGNRSQLEYTDRSNGLRFYSTADRKGNLTSIRVIHHTRNEIPQSDLNTANKVLTTLI